MEASIIFFMTFVTGLYGSVFAISVNEVIKNRKRKKKQHDKVKF